MELASDLYTGRIRVVVMDTLPIPGIETLIGNGHVNASFFADYVSASPERYNENKKVRDALPLHAVF